MLSATIHRKLARECLDRAYRADTRNTKAKYLRLAVRNSMCAQYVCADQGTPFPSIPAGDCKRGIGRQDLSSSHKHRMGAEATK